MFILPTFADYLTLKQFKQHVRSTAGAVLLFQRDHVAGAHRTTVTLTARAQSDASQRRFGERTTIVGKFEMSIWLDGLVVDS